MNLSARQMGWDEDVADSTRRYWGDFVSKIVSGRGAEWRGESENKLDSKAPAISALTDFWWECAKRDGWPMSSLPDEYCRLDTIETQVLIVNGNLDFTSELQLTQGNLILHTGVCVGSSRLQFWNAATDVTSHCHQHDTCNQATICMVALGNNGTTTRWDIPGG